MNQIGPRPTHALWKRMYMGGTHSDLRAHGACRFWNTLLQCRRTPVVMHWKS